MVLTVSLRSMLGDAVSIFDSHLHIARVSSCRVMLIVELVSHGPIHSAVQYK